MPLEGCALRHDRTGCHHHRFPFDSQHIRLQFDAEAAIEIPLHHLHKISEEALIRGEAYIQVDSSVIIDKDTGVKAVYLVFRVAQGMSVRPAHIAIEFVRPLRTVCDCHRRNGQHADLIVQIESAVRTLKYIRGIHDPFSFLILGVLIPAIDHAIIAPISQIGKGRRPANIISQTEILSTEMIVTAKYIQPVTKDSGFPIRDIFIAG